MPGNLTGGLRARDTNKKNDPDFYRKLGALGGSAPHSDPRGFASNVVGKDGLTGKERARKCGAVGGRISRRGPKDAS